MTAVTGLARVTVSAPQRRIDVALPEHAPLAELLPELLRYAGEGLADAGQAHGGWVLRRTDGAALSVATGLAHQGVRDGDVLHLTPALVAWPELEYDDVVDAIAAGARRSGRAWDGVATRVTGIGLAAVALLLGIVTLARTSAGSPVAGGVGLAIGAGLLVGAVLATRAYGDAAAGAALSAGALAYALAGGALVLEYQQPTFGGGEVLLGSVALVLASVIGAVGVARPLPLFVAGIIIGLAGTVGGLLTLWLTGAGAAAVVLAVVVAGASLFPALAVRLGRLPTPVPAIASPVTTDREKIFAAVVRAESMLTGLLAGAAGAVATADWWLVRDGGTGGLVLAATGSGVLLLRARIFPSLRQRAVLLAGGAAGALLLVGVPVLTGGPEPVVAGIGLAVAASVLVIVGSAYRNRTPGPYLGRTADILDALCVVSVIPVACAVLGLYGRLRSLG